jgi:GR25 family glycosyltransferase involved in LPS biosynthesis
MKYTIVKVNDRSITNVNKNITLLSNFDYVDDIDFFNGNTGNAWDVINHKGINQNVWNPYDGRDTPPLKGELGVWVSTINVLEYIVKNNISQMLVLEDDIVLKENFVNNFKKCLLELPKDFDFLSLYYFDGHNQVTEETDVGLSMVHRSYNQYSGAQAMLYSYSGAKKLLKCIYRKGIEYTTDCFIFKQSLDRLVDGYSIKKKNTFFLKHEYKNIKSLIDPDNIRMVKM